VGSTSRFGIAPGRVVRYFNVAKRKTNHEIDKTPDPFDLFGHIDLFLQTC
jgi:hypothetical protein